MGSTIDNREYLKEYLKDIYKLLDEKNTNYYHIGPISKKRNPHHPLFLSNKYEFDEFNMKDYINNL